MANIRLLNITDDAAASSGELAIEDLTIHYDADGLTTGKVFKIEKNISASFHLNFNVTDSGKIAGAKLAASFLASGYSDD